MRPQLFALLVGINAYKKPITPLIGCLNDVRKLEAVLQEQTNYFDVHIKTLTDQHALKDSIITEFRNHLGMAKENDTVLFYYSGHGTQEEANPIFWSGEPDKKLECLVCYDGVTMVNGQPKMNLLADKELRFLIGELARTNVHIVTIFDCCHSGTNTRNGLFSVGSEILERKVIHRERLSMAFPERAWSNFIFSETISQTEALDGGISSLLREGSHVQMAACQNDESAYEVAGEGVFTKNLVEILRRCNSNISYHRLQSAIQSYLRHQFKQTPKIYVTGDHNQLFSGFLSKDTVESELYGNVTFHIDLGWVLDMGSLQGMMAKKELLLEEQDSKTEYKAQIINVAVTYSQIKFLNEANESLETTKIFKAKIDGIIGHNLHIFVTPEVLNNSNAPSLIQNIQESSKLNQIENISEADYCLIAQNDALLLTAPERMKIPLVPKILLKDLVSEGSTRMFHYLEHISKFEFVKYLTNTGSFMLRPDTVSIQIFIEDTPVAINNDEVVLKYQKTGDEWGGSIRVKIKNTSPKKLYAALCYLSFNCGVFTRILPTGVVGLEPGAEAWALDGAPIDFKLEPEITTLGYSESTSYLKLLISTEDFTQQLFTLTLDDLPGPLQEDITSRGLTIPKESEVVHDWTSRLITIRMPNPEL